MITIEQVKNILETDLDDFSIEFLSSPALYSYSDFLEMHREILWGLWTSFWIWELDMWGDNSMTIVYVFKWDTIHILCGWVPQFKTLELYVEWLNDLEEKSLFINN